MKSLRKLIAVIVLLVGVSGARVYATPSFEDVDNLFIENNLGVSGWAKESVYDAWVDGLLDESGVKYNTDLTKPATREEVAEIAYGYVVNSISEFEKDYIMSTSKIVNFQDTDNTKVTNAAKLGLVNGRSESKFCPYDTITREEVSAIMYRAEQLIWGDDNLDIVISQISYEDGNKISTWALDSINYLTYKEQLKGMDNGYFVPQGNMTRQEAIIFANRLYSNRFEYVILDLNK